MTYMKSKGKANKPSKRHRSQKLDRLYEIIYLETWTYGSEGGVWKSADGTRWAPTLPPKTLMPGVSHLFLICHIIQS